MRLFNTGDREAGDAQTRRDVLRGMFSTGLLATASAGLSGLLLSPPARAATTQLPVTMVLNALPADTPANVRAAIESGCCTTYTREEGHCGSPGCGTGYCCYHVYSANCGVDYVGCVEVSCAEGNFTTGC